MHIAPFAIVLIVLFVVFSYKHGLTAARIYDFGVVGFVLSDLLVNVGYFVKIGNFSLRYNEAFLVLAFLACIVFFLSRKRGNRTLMTCLGFSLLAIVFSFIAFFVSGKNELSMLESSTAFSWDMYAAGEAELQPLRLGSSTIFVIAKFVMVGIVFAYLPSRLRRLNYARAGKKLFNIYLIVGIYLVLEALEVYLLKGNNLRTISLWVFGNQGLANTDVDFSGRTYGFFSEPSMLSLSLFVFALLSLALYRNRIISRGSFIFSFVGGIALMALSRSFSSLLYLPVLYILFFLLEIKKRARLTFLAVLVIVPVGAGVALLRLNNGYFLNRLIASLQVMGDFSSGTRYFTSEWIRLHSIVHLLGLFIKHPVFGVGFNSTYSYSAVSSILATVGLFGFVSLLYYWFQAHKIFFGSRANGFATFLFLIVFLMIGSTGSLLLYYPSVFLAFSLMSLIAKKGRAVIAGKRKTILEAAILLQRAN